MVGYWSLSRGGARKLTADCYQANWVPYQLPDRQSFNNLIHFNRVKKQGGIIYHVPRTGTKTLTTSNADVYYLSGVHFVSFSGLFGSETGRARLGTITNMLHTFQQSLKYPRRFALSCSKENRDCKVQRLQMCIGCLASMLSQLFCSRMGRPRNLEDKLCCVLWKLKQYGIPNRLLRNIYNVGLTDTISAYVERDIWTAGVHKRSRFLFSLHRTTLSTTQTC